MTIPHVLRTAAQRIERDGWKRGEQSWIDGQPCCAAVAIRLSSLSSPLDSSAAWTALRKFVGARSVAEWNDTPGRTVDEVLAALRGAADAVERGEP